MDFHPSVDMRLLLLSQTRCAEGMDSVFSLGKGFIFVHFGLHFRWLGRVFDTVQYLDLTNIVTIDCTGYIASAQFHGC